MSHITLVLNGTDVICPYKENFYGTLEWDITSSSVRIDVICPP